MSKISFIYVKYFSRFKNGQSTTMATTTTSKRISRLKSREPSVVKTLVSERKLKPRKVVNNRNSKKNNVSVKRKSLSVSRGNVSLRNSQTLLTRLRPRRNRKNYCEDSRLLQQYILPKQQNSVVMLQKLNLKDGKKKKPVYKAIESSEKSLEDKTDVYDFKFDANDTREKAKKKQRKRKNVTGKGKMTQKTTGKKITAQPKTIGRKVVKSSKPDVSLISVEIVESNPPLKFATAKKLTKKNTAKKIETVEIDIDIQMPEELVNKEIEPPKIDIDIHTVEKSTLKVMETSKVDTNVKAEETTSSGRAFAEQIRKENANKPKVISIEDANNIIVTKSPPNNSEDSWPFRPKNIFDNKTSSKEHNTRKYSLLTKTLSPILKTTKTFDLGSPWRPPTLMFSQTKHFIQSTPYKNFEPHKENKEINKKNMKMNKENIEMNKENREVDKENVNMNKENKGRRDKERKKKKNGLREKLQRKLPISENQTPEKVPTVVASKSIVQPAPVRVSLGEIKNLLQRPNIKEDNKQPVEQTHTEVDKSLVEQKSKQLMDVINFSDTFDVLSETERLSNIGNDAPLFMDLEPSHFSKVFIIIFAHLCVCISFIN